MDPIKRHKKGKNGWWYLGLHSSIKAEIVNIIAENNIMCLSSK